MIVNSTDIRIYSEPPPYGTLPSIHNKTWRRVFSIEFDGLPSSSVCDPKIFSEKSVLCTASINSKYKKKRKKEMPFKSYV